MEICSEFKHKSQRCFSESAVAVASRSISFFIESFCFTQFLNNSKDVISYKKHEAYLYSDLLLLVMSVIVAKRMMVVVIA